MSLFKLDKHMEDQINMASYNVLMAKAIGNNTAIVVDCPGKEFRNGIEIKDENNQTFKLLSVGLVGGRVNVSSFEKTTILVEGIFTSKKIIVY